MCEVAREMYDAGYTKESLPEWMCLVNGESAFNSSAIGGPNTNGSFDWGLFQVNDNFWCTVEGVGKDCNINCNGNFFSLPHPLPLKFSLSLLVDLVDDDIADDLECIAIIFARHGFSAWNAWKTKCQSNLENWEVDSCF